jgi:hypothetical protein
MAWCRPDCQAATRHEHVASFILSTAGARNVLFGRRQFMSMAAVTGLPDDTSPEHGPYGA